MPDILENNQIPYQDQAVKLFNLYGERLNKAGEQQVIPFLGAGVSISERSFNSTPKQQPNYPDRQTLDSIFQKLNLHDEAKVFLEVAILLACRLQTAQVDPAGKSVTKFLNKLQDDAYPPSAGELAQLFSQLSQYTKIRQVVKRIREELPPNLLGPNDEDIIEALRLMTKEIGIANPPDPLASITSYYQKVNGRVSLWDNLSLVISKKETPSRTHKLLALAAKHHLEQRQVLDDYLIITTNFDCLMEKALDELSVPYAVIVTKRTNQKVLVRFSKNVTDAGKLSERNSNHSYPVNFYLSKYGNLAIIYKIHGCLSPELKDSDDGIVISDDDYVNYLSQMSANQGVIPAQVNAIMQKKSFLFLGYSLNDWNVRSIFETLRKKREADSRTRDFSVMYKVEEYEKVFFDSNDVQILKTDLNTYVEGIRQFLPDDL